jgi:hypothetical protein
MSDYPSDDHLGVRVGTMPVKFFYRTGGGFPESSSRGTRYSTSCSCHVNLHLGRTQEDEILIVRRVHLRVRLTTRAGIIRLGTRPECNFLVPNFLFFVFF